MNKHLKNLINMNRKEWEQYQAEINVDEDIQIRNHCFDGEFLDGFSFKGIDFTGSSFRGASLSRVDFSGAILNSVDFTKAKLVMANLNETDCSSANFSEADLEGASFCGTNLEYAGFFGAKIKNVVFNNARNLKLEGTRFENLSLKENKTLEKNDRVRYVLFVFNPENSHTWKCTNQFFQSKEEAENYLRASLIPRDYCNIVEVELKRPDIVFETFITQEEILSLEINGTSLENLLYGIVLCRDDCPGIFQGTVPLSREVSFMEKGVMVKLVI